MIEKKKFYIVENKNGDYVKNDGSRIDIHEGVPSELGSGKIVEYESIFDCMQGENVKRKLTNEEKILDCFPKNNQFGNCTDYSYYDEDTETFYAHYENVDSLCLMGRGIYNNCIIYSKCNKFESNNNSIKILYLYLPNIKNFRGGLYMQNDIDFSKSRILLGDDSEDYQTAFEQCKIETVSNVLDGSQLVINTSKTKLMNGMFVNGGNLIKCILDLSSIESTFNIQRLFHGQPKLKYIELLNYNLNELPSSNYPFRDTHLIEHIFLDAPNLLVWDMTFSANIKEFVTTDTSISSATQITFAANTPLDASSIENLVNNLPNHTNGEAGSLTIPSNLLSEEQTQKLNNKNWTIIDANTL